MFDLKTAAWWVKKFNFSCLKEIKNVHKIFFCFLVRASVFEIISLSFQNIFLKCPYPECICFFYRGKKISSKNIKNRHLLHQKIGFPYILSLCSFSFKMDCAGNLIGSVLTCFLVCLWFVCSLLKSFKLLSCRMCEWIIPSLVPRLQK